jgi:hypothetical protein
MPCALAALVLKVLANEPCPASCSDLPPTSPCAAHKARVTWRLHVESADNLPRCATLHIPPADASDVALSFRHKGILQPPHHHARPAGRVRRFARSQRSALLCARQKVCAARAHARTGARRAAATGSLCWTQPGLCHSPHDAQRTLRVLELDRSRDAFGFLPEGREYAFNPSSARWCMAPADIFPPSDLITRTELGRYLHHRRYSRSHRPEILPGSRFRFKVHFKIRLLESCILSSFRKWELRVEPPIFAPTEVKKGEE